MHHREGGDYWMRLFARVTAESHAPQLALLVRSRPQDDDDRDDRRRRVGRGRAQRAVRRRADRRAADRGGRDLHHPGDGTSACLHCRRCRRQHGRKRRGCDLRAQLQRARAAPRHRAQHSGRKPRLVRRCRRSAIGRLDAGDRARPQCARLRFHHPAVGALPRRRGGAGKLQADAATIFRCERRRSQWSSPRSRPRATGSAHSPPARSRCFRS